MSRQFRHRVTAVVLGGLLLGAPLLTNGTANAGQVEGHGPQVVFDGGMLGISCSSVPDLESMTVPADSTVMVVNRTGRNARLLLSGTEKGAIPDNGSAQVVFRRGATAVTLDPDCTLGDEATPTLVTAASSTPADVPGPIPVPPSATPVTAAATSGPGSPSTSTAAGATLPDSPGLSASRPQHATAGAITPGASRASVVRPGHGSAGAATMAAEAMPPGGLQIRLRSETSRRTTGAGGPAFSGMPPGADKAVVPAVPSIDLSQPTGVTPAAPAVPTTEIAAAEPVAAMEPMSPERPIGLLALVAAVCVVGVGVGAIRAFAAQRASRATIA